MMACRSKWVGFFELFTVITGCDDTVSSGQGVERVGKSMMIVDEPVRRESLTQGPINVQDECPKLVQKRIDRTIVSRQEQILGNTCDYFIYPNVGEVVGVSVSDTRMKPFLDIPYYHDFANGDYLVVANGRHVIRLEYDSFERKPSIMNYVLEVKIIPAQKQ